MSEPAPTNARDRTLGILGLLLAFIGFSMSGVWVRWLVALDPLALTGWRVVVALGVLIPLILIQPGERADAQSLLRVRRIHTTALRMTGFFVIAVVGFQRAPVALVLLCLGLSPAWVLVLQRLRGAVIPPQKAIGVGLALLGATVGLAPPLSEWVAGGGSDAANAGIGALCGLAAGLLSASYAVERQTLRGPGGEVPSAFLLASVTCLWGLGVFACAFLTQMGGLRPSTALEWGALAGFGVVSTAAPLWGFAAASKSLPPLLVALTTPLIPFGGAFAAWLLLGQVPPLAFAVGAPIVLVGIVRVLTARA